jgi:hypothetical protein
MFFNVSGTFVPQIETMLESCGFICDLATDRQVTPMLSTLLTNDEKSISEHILQSRRYDVMINTSSSNNTQETHSCTLRAKQMPSSAVEDRDLRSRRFWKDNDFYRTSVRSVSNNSYFFPTTGMYNFTCGLVNMTYQCKIGSNVSVNKCVSNIQTPINRFKTSLFLANKKVKNMILAKGFSDWVGSKAGSGSSEMNATCSNVYTQVSRNVLSFFPLCYCRSVLQLFLNFKEKVSQRLNFKFGRTREKFGACFKILFQHLFVAIREVGKTLKRVGGRI